MFPAEDLDPVVFQIHQFVVVVEREVREHDVVQQQLPELQTTSRGTRIDITLENG